MLSLQVKAAAWFQTLYVPRGPTAIKELAAASLGDRNRYFYLQEEDYIRTSKVSAVASRKSSRTSLVD